MIIFAGIEESYDVGMSRNCSMQSKLEINLVWFQSSCLKGMFLVDELDSNDREGLLEWNSLTDAGR